MEIKSKLAMLGILVLSVLLMSGCVSKSQYEQLESDYASLGSEYKTVQSEYESLQNDYADLQSNYESLQNDYDALRSESESLQNDYSSLKSEYESLQDNYTSLESAHQSLQTDRATLQERLDALESKYPPRLFKDASELEAWLANQPNYPESADAVLWFNHARDLQKAAAEDGYIISADIWDHGNGEYTVWCSAVLQDHSYYWWNPETDEIYFAMDVRHF